MKEVVDVTTGPVAVPIAACVNDCVLFRNVDPRHDPTGRRARLAELDACPVCAAPRYVKGTKRSRKIFWYRRRVLDSCCARSCESKLSRFARALEHGHVSRRRFPLVHTFRWLFSDPDWAARVARRPRRTDGIVEVRAREQHSTHSDIFDFQWHLLPLLLRRVPPLLSTCHRSFRD